jgi:hypothetical protein
VGGAEMQRSLNTDALGSLHRRRSPLADVQSSNLRAGVSSDWGPPRTSGSGATAADTSSIKDARARSSASSYDVYEPGCEELTASQFFVASRVAGWCWVVAPLLPLGLRSGRGNDAPAEADSP